ncbi:type VI secretion system lipoprotein TssJ [Hafnia paralvei]|uniref:type VI secretion system lipoprotein TssJ n=1 Tax=Hafnia paralvei TaxID=546367 RepID=UPI003CE80A6E
MIPRNRFAFWPVFMLPLAVTLLSGCAESTQQEKQAIAEVTAPFAASAITLNLTAEPQLNLWNEMSNSCTVLVIQAANNPALDKILDDPMQLKSLFNGAGTADEILQVDRYTVMPGQKNTLHIDRAEKTRNIAIVAGYFPFPSKKHMAYFAIPVATSSHGWISPQWQAQLAPLQANITLGGKALVKAETVNLSDDNENADAGDNSTPASEKTAD